MPLDIITKNRNSIKEELNSTVKHESHENKSWYKLVPKLAAVHCLAGSVSNSDQIPKADKNKQWAVTYVDRFCNGYLP